MLRTFPKLHIPVPRLLPLTIFAMVGLLGLKSGHLVLAATGHTDVAAVVPPAKAAEANSAEPRHEGPAGASKHPASGSAVVPRPSESAAASSPSLPPGEVPVQPISSSERSLLLDLRQRRLELDQREAALTAREGTLAAVERRLSSRVDELTALQARLEMLERQRKDHDEANWRGLVKLYETMKPRDAAAIFNDLELPVLLPVLDRMKEAKAAAVLSAMVPERARLVTSELAQMRSKANTVPPAAG